MTTVPNPRFGLAKAAIFAPRLDFWLTSGLSLVVMMAVLLAVSVGILPTGDTDGAVLPKLLMLQVLLNWPHFMVSYRLLYRDRENLRRFPMASIGVPIVLCGICIAATLPVFGGGGVLNANISIAYIIWVFAALYLAWHYTGQTWGVMMIFARLSGMSFNPIERMILRNGFRALIAWHVIWGLASLPPLPYVTLLQHPNAQIVVNVAACVAAVLGATVWVRKALRAEVIDIRVLGAWCAVYMWYVVLWVVPDAFILVQLSHALQYLVFPARIEMNTKTPARPAPAVRTTLVYLVCIGTGVVVFYLPEVYLLSPTGGPTVFALIAIMINIHHYYTDSAIWRLRDKTLRDRLFQHVS